MAENSKIGWTDHTFNPWEGCTKVSPGCKLCYAEALNQRFKNGVNWGKGAPRQKRSAAYWRKPVLWNARYLKENPEPCSGMPRRPRVFCASVADWLDDEVPVEWLADLLDLIWQTPHLDWLLLTKRPQNFGKRVSGAFDSVNPCFSQYDNPDEVEAFREGPEGKFHRWMVDWKWGHRIPHNVWVGTSVEDQERAEERIPELLKIPARVRFLSCEPLLSEVDLLPFTERNRESDDLSQRMIPGLHWVICGGESGPGCRPMELAWARSLRDQCRKTGVPFFMKQVGGHPNKREKLEDLPEDLRIREFPNP